MSTVISDNITPADAWNLLVEKWPDRAQALRNLIEIGFTPQMARSFALAGNKNCEYALIVERAAQHLNANQQEELGS